MSNLNLKDLYKPIGRLYEEVPSADYRGDYLAANGWYNATEEDADIKAIKAEIASINNQIQAYKIELSELTSGTANCEYQALVLPLIPRGYNCKDLQLKYGTYKKTSGKYKNWTFVEYDSFQKIGSRIKVLQNEIAYLEGVNKENQKKLDDLIVLKKKSTEASQETKTQSLLLEGIKEQQQSKQKEEESKQKQTEAELRAKKIFLAIIASGLILSATGYALFRR